MTRPSTIVVLCAFMIALGLACEKMPPKPELRPRIVLTPTALSFAAVQNGTPPASKSFTITNTGGGTLNWSVSDTAAWLGVGPTDGSSNSATITASITITNRTPGTYNTTITVSSTNADNSPQIVAVTYVVTASPHIDLDSSAISFEAVQNGAPPAKSFKITNTGGGTLNWSVSDNATWLGVSPTSGSSNSATITASITNTNLTPGTSNATITVSSTNADNTPRTIAVTYVVIPSSTQIQGALTMAPGHSGDLSGTRVAIYASLNNWLTDTPVRFVAPSGSGANVTYVIDNVVPGDYYLDAWKDINSNSEMDAGDLFGWYGNGIYPNGTLWQFSIAAGEAKVIDIQMFVM